MMDSGKTLWSAQLSGGLSMVPNDSELNCVDPEIQELYSQRQSLQLIDGILYRNYERPELRNEFLQYSHAGLINGHFGVETGEVS